MATQKKSGAAKAVAEARKAVVLNLQGKASVEVELPEVFQTDYRPDLIQRAFVAEQSWLMQPYGPSKDAGLNTTADYFGRRREYYRMTINRGISRLPRVKLPKGGLGKVLRIPSARGGRRAHPPKPEAIRAKKINAKEWELALKSAIAATSRADLAKAEGRSHILPTHPLPLVVDASFEKLGRTKEIRNVLEAIGLEAELSRVRSKNRAGKGKMRGRRKKTGKSLLVILSGDCKALHAAENIRGVDAVTVDELDVSLLAPGGFAGRLTLWTEPALKKLSQ